MGAFVGGGGVADMPASARAAVGAGAAVPVSLPGVREAVEAGERGAPVEREGLMVAAKASGEFGHMGYWLGVDLAHIRRDVGQFAPDFDPASVEEVPLSQVESLPFFREGWAAIERHQGHAFRGGWTTFYLGR